MKNRFLACAVILACLVSCNKEHADKKNDRPIVILYENDVHCAVEGYAKLAGLRDAMVAADTAYVAVVSAGDFLQGGLTGSLSKGADIIPIMNAVGYDAVTLGNHEFDYGIPTLLEDLKDLNTDVVCANFVEKGTLNTVFAPYVIKTYGKKKIAFIGVITPHTVISEYYAFTSKVDGKNYDINEAELTAIVQSAVDEARSKGADYVVVLSHLGEKDNAYTSRILIEGTRGIDALLDGHTHSVIESEMVSNIDGIEVSASQTGTAFANIGHLYISKEGTCELTLLPASEIKESSATVSAVLDGIAAKNEAITGKVMTTSEQRLSIYDENGNRIIRKQEVGIGNLVADALAKSAGASIGIISGGAIRTDIPKGAVTNGDLITVIPFDNIVTLSSLTGRQIINLLESGVQKLPGENGEFCQVSGLRYTVDISKRPRVQSVEVLQEDMTYVPIKEDAKYEVGIADYLLGMVSGDVNILNPNIGIFYIVVPEAIKNHFNPIGKKYAKPEGRIIIK